MRRKLGILILVIVTALAGAQEAAQTFDGLKSSVTNWTRASLWSGLIVYAQPVAADSSQLANSQPHLNQTLAAQSAATCPAGTTLADEGNLANAAAKQEMMSRHAAVAVLTAEFNDREMTARESEATEATRSEFETEARELKPVAADFSPSLPMPAPHVARKRRAFEEIAMNAPVLLKFAREAGMNPEAFVSDFDAARLLLGAAQLAGERARFEELQLRAHGEMEKLNRRFEVRVVRLAERRERVKPASRRMAQPRREVSWPEALLSAPPAPPEASAVTVNAGASAKCADKVSLFGCEAGAER